MELGKRAVVLVMMMVALFGVVAMGEVYKVGESNGWTNTAPIFDYKAWAASKTFHVGDTIIFEYNKQFQNVVRVTHKNFKSCNATAPYRTLTTGNDSFVIPKHGHFFFICGLPGHCESGQKVDIRVPQPSSLPPSSYMPSQAPSPSPSASKSASAQPLANGGMWLSVVVLALSVYVFAY
ncbi:hypothetical protein Vadar_010068 [Vaccinium darrowii]|uniref:Uncharacterized protein n=1 Tax=Vaccinium darrowii TaxID=229202 RepID=A0ACB7ZBM9_9ERIC|nr:hypothetical protein Vadar_010068 [Vaccinium darrowii]